MKETSHPLSEREKLIQARLAIHRIFTYGAELTKQEILEICHDVLEITVPETPLIRFTL